MNNVQEVIENSKIIVHPERYKYVKVAKIPDLNSHFMITRDLDEISVVANIEEIDKLDILEENNKVWKLIEIELSVPFTAGFLARTLEIIRDEAGGVINTLVVSTFSKDYLIIREDQIEDVRQVLEKAGFIV